MTHEEDEPMAESLRADAARVGPLPSDLWDRIEQDIDKGGVRESVLSRATLDRRILGVLGVLAAGVMLVLIQGVRADLDGGGWAQFALGAVPMVLGGLLAVAAGLGHRGRARDRPLRFAVVGWLWMAGLSALAPWPGMTGVPASMHLYCFGMTSVAVLLAIPWLAWLERGRSPVWWRVAASGAGAGAVAFAFQSVFCPGIDLVHLVVGHGGAGLVWGLLGAAAALVLARSRS